MVKDATFVSVWDYDVLIMTPCSVNMETKQVFNIKTVDPSASCNVLDEEYIIVDEEKLPVFQLWELSDEDDEFWYE